MDSIRRSIATVFGVAFLLLPGCGHSLSWQNVPIGAGGFVTGIYADPNVFGLIYISTDVGGAYRWAVVAPERPDTVRVLRELR